MAGEEVSRRGFVSAFRLFRLGLGPFARPWCAGGRAGFHLPPDWACSAAVADGRRADFRRVSGCFAGLYAETRGFCGVIAGPVTHRLWTRKRFVYSWLVRGCQGSHAHRGDGRPYCRLLKTRIPSQRRSGVKPCFTPWEGIWQVMIFGESATLATNLLKGFVPLMARQRPRRAAGFPPGLARWRPKCTGN